MKRLLLAIGFWLGLTALASAQCVSSAGVNTVPTVGQNCLTESTIDTYSATSIGLVPAASATDIACITGSASRIVRVLSVRVSGSAGTLVSVPVVLVKRASANTGGTLATSTALPVPYKLDTTDAAPTATTSAWTANPTIVDTSPGLLDVANVTFNVTTAAGGTPFNFTYLTHIYNEPPTLRGVAQQVCINLNGVSVSSGVLAISFLWTENSI